MLEVLPINNLLDEDSQIFGSLNVALGKLHRLGIPVPNGIVITFPSLKLKTFLEHYDFGSKEIFEQSLTLVKKDLYKIPIPEILLKELGTKREFYLSGSLIKSPKLLWEKLIDEWVLEIKNRLWKDGFYKGITDNLTPQKVFFLKKPISFGKAYYELEINDVRIEIMHGDLHPKNIHEIDQLVLTANKKLFLPFVYEWVFDSKIYITNILPFTPKHNLLQTPQVILPEAEREVSRASTKIILDISESHVLESETDGVFINSEKILDLNKPRHSLEELTFKLVESSTSLVTKPVFIKLADFSEGMGSIRGSLRLLHQQNALDILSESVLFAVNKKNLQNIRVVIPFVRQVSEFLQIKRELAVRKIIRKKSLELWMEIAVPENIVDLENYLIAGLDGVVINLDELLSHLRGFDHNLQELIIYKKELEVLTKFLDDPLKMLHKSKIPFLVTGSLSLYPEILDFLIEKGVYGITVPRYEYHGLTDLLKNAEKKLVLRRVS